MCIRVDPSTPRPIASSRPRSSPVEAGWTLH
jgi:hypothetical protein